MKNGTCINAEEDEAEDGDGIRTNGYCARINDFIKYMFMGNVVSKYALDAWMNHLILVVRLSCFPICLLLEGFLGSAVILLTSWCIRQGGRVYGSSFNPLVLVIVFIFSWLVLKQDLSLGRLLGAGFILLGLYLLLWGKRNEKLPEDKEETIEEKEDDRDQETDSATRTEEDLEAQVDRQEDVDTEMGINEGDEDHNIPGTQDNEGSGTQIEKAETSEIEVVELTRIEKAETSRLKPLKNLKRWKRYSLKRYKRFDKC